MEMPTPAAPAETAPEPVKEAPKARPRRPSRIPSIIVGLVVAAIAGLSIWYLVRPQPLLVQGEVDATRLDIAARVDGRVGDIPVDARPERRRRRRAGADRQPGDAREARAGAGRQGRRRGAARQHQCRHAAGGHRGAQGRARAGAGERGPGAEDLRPRQPAGRAWQCAAGAARPGDRCPARKPARRGSGQIGLRAGGQRLHARGARDRRRRMSARRSPTSRPCNRSSTRWWSTRR